MKIQQKYIQIELLLKQVKDDIINEIGINPFEDLDKSIRIVSKRNYNQLNSVNQKIKNLSMALYNRGFICSKSIFEKIDKIFLLINEY